PERPHIVDDVTGILIAGEETASEQVNDPHAFRRHALGRMIDVEQKIHIPALAEDNVFIHSQVAGVLSLCRETRKTRQRRSCHERTGRLYKTASVDLLHLSSPPFTAFVPQDNSPERPVNEPISATLVLHCGITAT